MFEDGITVEDLTDLGVVEEIAVILRAEAYLGSDGNRIIFKNNFLGGFCFNILTSKSRVINKGADEFSMAGEPLGNTRFIN